MINRYLPVHAYNFYESYLQTLAIMNDCLHKLPFIQLFSEAKQDEGCPNNLMSIRHRSECALAVAVKRHL